jgi:integrase
VRPVLDYLQRFEVVPRQAFDAVLGPVDVMLDRFSRYLTVERALAAVTGARLRRHGAPVHSRTAKRAGLGRIHAHRLRHTAAMQMLRAGASLPEIGQLLRHRRALTTAIYAKVDRDTLRTIARPWPGDAA